MRVEGSGTAAPVMGNIPQAEPAGFLIAGKAQEVIPRSAHIDGEWRRAEGSRGRNIQYLFAVPKDPEVTTHQAGQLIRQIEGENVIRPRHRVQGLRDGVVITR